MTLLRSLAIISASLLMLNGCGGKKEQAPEQPVQTTTETSADELFDEFYDSSDITEESSVAEETMPEVEEEVVEESAEIPTPDFAPDGRYVVQISCVASEAIAEDVARKLENSGYPVYVAEVQNPTPTLLGTYYRIRIGGFNNVTSAKLFGENHLLPSGFDYWVDNRSNDNVGIGDFGLGDQTSFADEEPMTTESNDDFVEETYTSEPAQTVQQEVEQEVEQVVETATETATETVEAATEAVETATQSAAETAAEAASSVADDEWGTSDW